MAKPRSHPINHSPRKERVSLEGPVCTRHWPNCFQHISLLDSHIGSGGTDVVTSVLQKWSQDSPPLNHVPAVMW